MVQDDVVERAFTAPSFREHQRGAIKQVYESLFEKDNDVVKLVAPTGSGKSIMLQAVANMGRAEHGGKTFFTTPLNTLIDQLEEDDFIDPMLTLKGRNNYSCIHPADEGTSVDKAICQRESGFECDYKGKCPYYGRKARAEGSPVVGTSVAYIMAESMIPDSFESKLSDRLILIVDECQKIEDFALNFVGVNITPRKLPIDYDEVSPPPRTGGLDAMIEWVKSDIEGAIVSKIEEYAAKETLREDEVSKMEMLTQEQGRISNFLFDVENNEWTFERDTDRKGKPKVSFEPVYVGRFLHRLLWSRGHKVVLSSATIPKGSWIEEVGLGQASVDEVSVPSTFPVENRPVITGEAVGKMTYRERDRTIPKMADKIVELMERHDGEKGFIHCRSYGIAERLYNALPPHYRRRARLQDSDDREASLESWKDSDIQVFFSVAMDEGIDLKYDDCRWQVLAKALYRNMRNKRVEYRMDQDKDGGADWTWYNSAAVIQIQQAYGRGVRAPDDECTFYVLDQSAVDLINRSEWMFEDWFLEAVK